MPSAPDYADRAGRSSCRTTEAGILRAAELADVVELEEGRAGREPTVAEAGEQGDAPLYGDQTGGDGGVEGGEVDEFAASAERSGW